MAGTLYYKFGAVRYVGGLSIDDDGFPYYDGLGVEYYEHGGVYKIGIFRRTGLENGCEFYPDGVVKFFAGYRARYNRYGPSYPKEGVYLAPEGSRHIGCFNVSLSAVGIPRVVEPSNYGDMMCHLTLNHAGNDE